PALLAYRQLDRWDGKLPMYNGAQLPMLTIDVGKIAEMPEAERKKRMDELLAVPTAPSSAPPASSAPKPAPSALP
ncbi:MAG: hypothetical protein ACXWP4_22620, partial [Polyangiales bacterium]